MRKGQKQKEVNPENQTLIYGNGMAIYLTLSSSSLIATALAVCLILLTTFIFHKSPFYTYPSPHIPHRSLLSQPISCSSLKTINNDGLLNYLSLHFCFFEQNKFLSLPSLCLLIILFFYVLSKTAQSHFSVVTTRLSSLLNLSPSMAGVTLLALGNGAPDVFASLSAVRSGQYRTGFGAILSAGAFVSAFVVGFVAIYSAPFPVDPAPFVRDVMFYMTAALFLFYVYLSGEIFMWQAVGFVGFYVFFVGLVFWMDLGIGGEKGKLEKNRYLAVKSDPEIGEGEVVETVKEEAGFGFRSVYGKISKVWEFPVSFILKLTIPRTAPSEWNRVYLSVNIALCPLVLLYACNSFAPFDHPIVFILPNTHLPLWLLVLLASSSLAILHFTVEKEPPKTEQVFPVLVTFVMSVFWISTVAGELLNCLAALGTLLELPPQLLGLTVLAWGNSVGDLVADVAVAKAGQPAMAMAGCFACPMFNMLVGLGTALVVQTANIYPQAYELHFHIGIVIAFVFLLLSLMGSLLVITWSRFRVPRFWGYCLVGLYIFFTAVTLIIAKFSG
ncbi:cation exchanger family protein [Tripterygium wilfordii]|uniref:Cation exchanger family protein n=1 Tax=Tripterygium wilfordii TaxID=458696 RepID=A0A7J7D2V7_TRIWF|nr:cation/calcium exchanger 5-like [Tripterygium wilfordii]KAF5740598.1 cation exchanger family protein [Tripterygium wilfordii]